MSLKGIKVLELAGLAPAPFAGMVLADHGAKVIRVDRPNSESSDVLTRGKQSIALSLKAKAGVDLFISLVKTADVLLDPYRPGVLEKLKVGPDILLKANPRLIVVRLSGFRREGPYSSMAGHDLNYIALSGVLDLLGRSNDRPAFPANILADFAGGGLMAVQGTLLALVERAASGKGQVVNVDMLSGARYVSSFPLAMAHPLLNNPYWNKPRGQNRLDGGAPFYEVFETKDGKYMSVGCLENHFYKEFLDILIANSPSDLVPSPVPSATTQMDDKTWPSLLDFFTRAFKTKTRDEWNAIYIGTDACCVPILSPSEVNAKGENKFEKGFVPDKEILPIPAPHLSRTPGQVSEVSANVIINPGAHTFEVLRQLGLSDKELKSLASSGTIQDKSSKL